MFDIELYVVSRYSRFFNENNLNSLLIYIETFVFISVEAYGVEPVIWSTVKRYSES